MCNWGGYAAPNIYPYGGNLQGSYAPTAPPPNRYATWYWTVNAGAQQGQVYTWYTSGPNAFTWG